MWAGRCDDCDPECRCLQSATTIVLSGKARKQNFYKYKGSQTLEQIWMPGVHSDVGGSSDAVLLGYVSLLTMLDRIKSYCPNLVIFEDIFEEVKKKNMRIYTVSIFYERSKPWLKIMRRGIREIGINTEEYVHPIVALLLGKTFNQRGRLVKYHPFNWTDAANRLQTPSGLEDRFEFLNESAAIQSLRERVGA